VAKPIQWRTDDGKNFDLFIATPNENEIIVGQVCAPMHGICDNYRIIFWLDGVQSIHYAKTLNSAKRKLLEFLTGEMPT